MKTKSIIFDAYGTLFDVNSAAEKCKDKIGDSWEGFANSVMNKPDVVLLNLELPVMDGLEMVRLVRTETDCAHLILLGFSLKELSSEFAETAQRLGLNQLVEYPFAQQLPAELFKMLPVATQG